MKKVRKNAGIFGGMFILACMFALLTPALPGRALENNPQEDRAQEEETLRVVYPLSEGYAMIDENGHHYGLIADYLNEIAKYTGWKYEYIDVDSDSLMDFLYGGDYDLAGGIYYSEEYEKYFEYPDYHCGYNRIYLLARNGDDSIKSYDYGTLNGKTIGAFDQAGENVEKLKKILKLYNINCNIKYYTYEEMMAAGSLSEFLDSEEIDLLLNNDTLQSDKYFVAADFELQEHYLVARAGDRETVEALNNALRRIYESDPAFAERAYRENFQRVSEGSLSLSREERDYIREKGTVTVAVAAEWHPFFCLQNSDTHEGIVPNMLEKIERFSGLSFQYVICDSYADAIRKVQQGEADILGSFLDSEEDAAALGLAKTVSYSEMSTIVVKNKRCTYPGDGLVGGILEGREMPESIVVDEIRYYTDLGQALSDVNKGKIDILYGISAYVESMLQKRNYNNIMQLNLIDKNDEVGFAVASPVEPELFSILNKAINHMTAEQKEILYNSNAVSIGSGRMSVMEIIYANPMLVISVAFIFVILILVIVMQITKSRIRSVTMKAELRKAADSNKAKSEFLSRMSHEIRTPMNAIVGLTSIMEMTEGVPENIRESLFKIKEASKYMLSLINDILDMNRIESGMMTLASEPFSVKVLMDEIDNMMEGEAKLRQLCFNTVRNVGNELVFGDGIRLRQVIQNLLSNAFKFTPAGGSVTLRADEKVTSEGIDYTFQVTDTGIGIAESDRDHIFGSFEQLGPNITKSQGTGLGLTISNNIVKMMGSTLEFTSEPGKGSTFYFTVRLQKAGKKLTATELAKGKEKVSLTGMKVLLAEDNDMNAEIAINILEILGISVKRAQNGKEAVALFQKSPEGEIDAVLMDIMMPEMNGLEATRQIRRCGRPDGAAVAIIAMTANAFEDDRRSAFEAGMTGFLSKPINIDLLVEELKKIYKDKEIREDQKEVIDK